MFLSSYVLVAFLYLHHFWRCLSTLGHLEKLDELIRHYLIIIIDMIELMLGILSMYYFMILKLASGCILDHVTYHYRYYARYGCFPVPAWVVRKSTGFAMATTGAMFARRLIARMLSLL